MHHIDHLLGHFGYGVVGLIVALEAMGLPLPGESLIIGSAVLAATGHRLSITWLIVSEIAGAIIGDNLGFIIGRSLGTRLLTRYGRKVGLSEDRLLLGRYLFRRYGGAVVLLGRFVALLRTFAALLAGANRMPWPRFLVWNALGGTLWVIGYSLAAYFAGRMIEHIAAPLGVAIGVVAVIVIAGLALLLRRHEHRLTQVARREAGLTPPPC